MPSNLAQRLEGIGDDVSDAEALELHKLYKAMEDRLHHLRLGYNSLVPLITLNLLALLLQFRVNLLLQRRSFYSRRIT